MPGDPAGPIQTDADAGLDHERLTEYIGQQLPEAEAISLSEATLHAGGVSRDHFRLDLRWRERGNWHELALVLIRDGDRPGQTDRGAEFRLLRALEQTSIPTPRAYWCDTSGEWLERPFIVMQRVGGAVTPTFQVPYAQSPALREKLSRGIVDTLADLHRLDWKALGIDFLEIPDCATGDLARVAARLFQATVGSLHVLKPHATTERAMSWCIDHAPQTRRWTLCHGDYKPDNILHDAGEILAVIDWERARIADPLADLGYVCAPHLRVGNLAAGLVEQADIVRRYAQRTGFEIEPEALRFWQVHLLLQTHLYFGLQAADAARRGHDVAGQVEPLMGYLLSLIDQTLDEEL